ncbi:hypothetical protein LEP1GSC021_0368 [Leptospira noguchii str. 1993005606]|uniref:Uncharacterized protein n=3 Tax=Leptospira noguchii TaxID=28182 RepID=M6Y8A7_9LEPT|nr:hypothetical protein LEP1GSC035_2615 [Leptospira noguchii str. 2007001578]EMO38800.1 hypothetical protein LEP1GSC186_2878 [Leptospira noguchii serovar Autumnalis str. ZUN142]EMO89980.1 hypothetical protein LEP1GSC024_4397 [Leptospira noguchii str. 2001034031]EPE82484.1 hypothetical protein LEP1GSC021_0368 [Leptospira noguchii str. 1993005606]
MDPSFWKLKDYCKKENWGFKLESQAQVSFKDKRNIRIL